MPKREMAIEPEQRATFKKTIDELIGTRAACIFDEKFNVLGKVPTKELVNVLKTVENPYAVVFDGKVDYDLENVSRRKGIKFLIGMEKENLKSPISILSKKDLE